MKDLTDFNYVKAGMKVVRGSGWEYRNQDAGSVYGIIINKMSNDSRAVLVDWIDSNGTAVNSNTYMIGPERHLAMYKEPKVFIVKKKIKE